MLVPSSSHFHFWQVFIGLAFPYEGPGPLEAISQGCVFINPKVGWVTGVILNCVRALIVEKFNCDLVMIYHARNGVPSGNYTRGTPISWQVTDRWALITRPLLLFSTDETSRLALLAGSADSMLTDNAWECTKYSVVGSKINTHRNRFKWLQQTQHQTSLIIDNIFKISYLEQTVYSRTLY